MRGEPLKVRCLRVSDREWQAFQLAARKRGESLSAAARRLFRDYVKGVRNGGS